MLLRTSIPLRFRSHLATFLMAAALGIFCAVSFMAIVTTVAVLILVLGLCTILYGGRRLRTEVARAIQSPPHVPAKHSLISREPFVFQSANISVFPKANHRSHIGVSE